MKSSPPDLCHATWQHHREALTPEPHESYSIFNTSCVPTCDVCTFLLKAYSFGTVATRVYLEKRFIKTVFSASKFSTPPIAQTFIRATTASESKYSPEGGGFYNAFIDNHLQEHCAYKNCAAHVTFLTLFQ
jgi:hypothetical protein